MLKSETWAGKRKKEEEEEEEVLGFLLVRSGTSSV
jgi:hypothetical protein